MFSFLIQSVYKASKPESIVLSAMEPKWWHKVDHFYIIIFFWSFLLFFVFFVYKYQTIIPVPLKKGFIQDQIQEDKRKFKGHEKFKSFRDKKKQ